MIRAPPDHPYPYLYPSIHPHTHSPSANPHGNRSRSQYIIIVIPNSPDPTYLLDLIQPSRQAMAPHVHCPYLVCGTRPIRDPYSLTHRQPVTDVPTPAVTEEKEWIRPECNLKPATRSFEFPISMLIAKTRTRLGRTLEGKEMEM